MDTTLIYPAGNTPACSHAARLLYKKGIPIVDHPTPEVTHLLLDVPSFASDGTLRGGGEIGKLLRMLPPGIRVIGGNLLHPALDGYRTADLLKDEVYLARNAAITAHCALQVATGKIGAIFENMPILVIGWGRIGKCLARLLRALGAEVTVAARKVTDRAALFSLGYQAVDIVSLKNTVPKWRIVFNTVPAPVLAEETLTLWKNCLKVELASSPGLAGTDIISARGLPGIYAPVSSGELIAENVIRIIKEEGT